MSLRTKIAKAVQLPLILFLVLKYRNDTMIPRVRFLQNLLLVNKFRFLEGAIVECGVWRGGMSGAMAELLGNRESYLFDSFEGLPKATSLDGQKAINYQTNTTDKDYLDNCSAAEEEARRTMIKSRKKHHLIKGWFKDTVPNFNKPIAVLRLDGDWYESTLECLTHLYPRVKQGGVIILDDYMAWEGCSKAVHDYLSRNKLADRIEKYGGVYYFTKREV